MTTGETVAYIRVSSVGQNTARQLDGMTFDRTFTDKCSGSDTNRPQLQALLAHVRTGDTVVVHESAASHATLLTCSRSSSS